MNSTIRFTASASGKIKVGDEVVAIGNPLGLDQTMTRGIVSGINRILPDVPGTTDEPMIQTDAAINPGNSGGPLLDRCGRMIGIATLIGQEGQNISFAIPINGQAIRGPDDFRNRPRLAKPGQPLRLTISRDGASQEVTLSVADRPRQPYDLPPD